MGTTWLAAAVALGIVASAKGADSPIKITLQPLCPGRISPMQYGQFIEYLCDLVPGMWSERLYDGNFEGLSPYKFEYIRQTDNREKPWYPSGAVNRAEYTLDNAKPVNGTVCQKIVVANGPKCHVGLSQNGVFVEAAKALRFSVWLRSEGATAVRVRIHDGGKTLAEHLFRPGSSWKRFEARMTPSSRSTNATFSIEFQGPSTLWLDAVSLMPEETVGGWRPDVVKALRELKPGVIRIGGSVVDDPNLGDFQWNDTIGNPDFRKPFRAWGGLQPTGPGLEEFVQLCRAVGAEPLICVRVRERTPKDAAEEVEYFNGSSSTKMGALRAKNGHLEPYRVRYWQVGNELSGATYEAKLPEFCKAMRAVDPSIKLMSSFPTDGVLTSAGNLLDFVCPHHYECDNLPAESDDFSNIRQMLGRLTPGRPIKVGVTEWNTTAGDRGLRRARLWTLENALACSRYHNLMHRNCDLVTIANRSNMTNSFCSGILQTNNHDLYQTPTYYAQRLYSNLAGQVPLRIDPAAPLKAGLDVSATLASRTGDVVVFAVNDSLDEIAKTLDLVALGKLKPMAEVWTLTDTQRMGEPDATNSFDNPTRVSPIHSSVPLTTKQFKHRFAALSLTVIRFHRIPSK